MTKAKPADFLSAAKNLMPTRELKIGDIDIVVRGLSVRQIEQANAYATKPAKRNETPEVDGEKLTARLIGISCFDKNGERLIPEDREGEVFDLPNDTVKKLSDAVFEINGLRQPKDDSGNS